MTSHFSHCRSPSSGKEKGCAWLRPPSAGRSESQAPGSPRPRQPSCSSSLESLPGQPTRASRRRIIPSSGRPPDGQRVHRNCRYRISLRERPPEVDYPIDGRTADLRIGGYAGEKRIPDEAGSVSFEVNLDRGKTTMRAGFSKPESTRGGAYSGTWNGCLDRRVRHRPVGRERQGSIASGWNEVSIASRASTTVPRGRSGN